MSQSRPAIPPDMKAFNRALIEEWRASGGKLSGPLAKSQLILLTTIGARSSEPRTVVIGYRPHCDELVASASDNGAPSDPARYRTLLPTNHTPTFELTSQKFEPAPRTPRSAHAHHTPPHLY